MEKLIRDSTEELKPIPTGRQALMRRFMGIRCLAFDVYGTLLISKRRCPDRAMAKLRKIYDLPHPARPLPDLIRREHRHWKAGGVDFPEVDIRELWQELYPDSDSERLALHYEMLSHAVWPMPGLEIPDGMTVALVSNAQFYTPLILGTLTKVVADPDLNVFSYRHRRAKPGTFLFEELAKALAQRKIRPSEVLYIGNDHEKDIVPAKAVGFRTVHFAGDARSFVHRPDLPAPDALITDLAQLPSLYEVSSLTN